MLSDRPVVQSYFHNFNYSIRTFWVWIYWKSSCTNYGSRNMDDYTAVAGMY